MASQTLNVTDESQRLADPMILPRLTLVDGNLELLTAAVANGGALEALLGVSARAWATSSPVMARLAALPRASMRLGRANDR